ncbi:N-acetylmuramoyl-L-alanine amidase [Streptococcus timonensis]|uniref:N-acetylmuramoyl-L-alanine amidase n=1 Tax=Streptococcus timonensis TaxID=1852387 RepID=UPI00094E8641|nr:N-acetylmuramoyl-L-alanine amidase [Streptococcus timonensis]
MKKTIVASAITLSVLGLTSPVFAEDSKIVETTIRDKATEVKEKIELPSSEEQTTTTNTPPASKPKEEAKVSETKKDGWIQEDNQWRFYENNKPVTKWKQIQGKWYYFDKDGNRISNTTFDGYAFDNDGVMASGGWIKLTDKWYYSNSSGKISQEKWEKIGNSWYYFDKNGIMLSNTIFNGYLFSNSGAMATNSWVKINEQWYYAQASGKPTQLKWENIENTWYFFNSEGAMASNQWKGNYFLKASGAMANKEWIFDKTYNSWFYLKAGGTYAANEWIGSYYLKSGGFMAKNEWIYDSSYKAWYYLKDDGVYVTGNYKINGKTHQFQSNGKWIAELSGTPAFEKGKYTKVIFIDPGHGGRDSGAFYYNIAEKDLNMQVYKKLRKELEGLGYTVLTSRESDVYVDFVTERSKMVNKTNADMFISIHFNATSNSASNVSGIQTYSYEQNPDYPTKINSQWHNHPDRISESNRLAAAIHSSLLAETGAKNAGLLHGSFAVLRETNKPAVLLELGYMSNFDENQRIRNDAYQNKLVKGIVKGIQQYYAGK